MKPVGPILEINAIKGRHHTPYTHWFWHNETQRQRANLKIELTGDKNLSDITPENFSNIPSFEGIDPNFFAAISGQNELDFTDLLKSRFFDRPEGVVSPVDIDALEGKTPVPVIVGSKKPVPDHQTSMPAEPDPRLIEMAKNIPDDAVITGIIDSGISLGHARFRNGTDKSRFLASWQQTAKVSENAAANDLPFGEELYQYDIEALMAQHTHDGYLDENAFNRATKTSEPNRTFGLRDLEGTAAHGTHVLDLAAGFDPITTSDLTKRPIIAVNLPDRYSHGSAGHFLEFFAILAIKRIVTLADTLWDLKYPNGDAPDGRQGFPIVINMSFGMQAGPKDSTMIFERTCDALMQQRKRDDKSRVEIVLPVGNDNLERCYCRSLMGESATKVMPIDWVVAPQDQTGNFVEVWSTALKVDSPEDAAGRKRLHLSVQAPAEADGAAEYFQLDSGTFAQLSDAVWVYAQDYFTRAKPKGEKEKGLYWTQRLVICTAPTFSHDQTPTAPAGRWKLAVQYLGEPVEISMNIQSDQNLTAQSRSGVRSYFEQPEYARFTNQSDKDGNVRNKKYSAPTGGWADTFGYPHHANFDKWGEHKTMQRRGTLNALASIGSICAIGGYRTSDGAPAPYSSSTHNLGRGTINPPIFGRQKSTAVFPTDNGGMRPGVLAAGSRSGAVVAWQGTSMAAGQATRMLVDALLAGAVKGDGTDWLAQQAEGQEKLRAKDGGPAWANMKPGWAHKLGFGRIEDNGHSRSKVVR